MRVAVCAVLTVVLGLATQPEEIARAIVDLGADDFATREKATAFLWSVGTPAEPALREALKSRDAEVVARARDLLDKIPFGITPDSPKKHVAMIARARAASADAWPAIVAELFEDGPEGLELARIIAGKQAEPARRRLLNRGIDREGWRLAVRFLTNGQLDRAEELLGRSASLSSGDINSRILRGYAAFVRVRGTLPAARKQWDSWATGPIGIDGLIDDKTPDGPSALRVAAYLAKAAGDHNRERSLAAKFDNNEWSEMALFDAGQWEQLAAFTPTDISGNRLRLAAAKAVYLRLANKAAEAAKARKQFDVIADETKTNRYDGRLAFRSLLFDGRTSEALEYAAKSSVSEVVVGRAEILGQKGQPRVGIEFLQKSRPPSGTDRMEYDAALVRMLFLVGDREQLDTQLALMKRDRYSNSAEQTQAAELVEQLVAFGLIPAAADHTAALLAGNFSPSEAFNRLCPNATLAGEAWYAFLTRLPGVDVPEVLRSVVSRIDDPRADATIHTELAQAATWSKSRPPAEREKLLRGFGEAYQRLGDLDRARELYQLAAESNPLASNLKLGDMFAEFGKWPDAAAAYERAAKIIPQSPLATFLTGFAKRKAGDAAGEKWQLTARLMLLGPIPTRAELTPADKLADERERQAFTEDLAKRVSFGDDIAETLRAERHLLVELSHPNSPSARTMLSMLTSDAHGFADHLTAASANQQFLLRMLRTNAYFKRNEGYLNVQHRIVAERARGLLAKGDVAGAVAAANEAHDILPTSISLAVNLVPELAKAGAVREADDFYGRVAASLDGLIRDYPKSGTYLNNRAWLAVRCRREPAAALGFAKRAVDQSPNNVNYLDTLAEAHFQLKQIEPARTIVKQRLIKSPRDGYLIKLLERIDAGDSTADLPER